MSFSNLFNKLAKQPPTYDRKVLRVQHRSRSNIHTERVQVWKNTGYNLFFLPPYPNPANFQGLARTSYVCANNSYGVVQEAVGPNGKVAIKVISKKTVKGHEHMVYDEMNLLKRLNHPHIVRFYEWFESTKNFYIVTALATGGELFERICECGRFTESDAVVVVHETLE